MATETVWLGLPTSPDRHQAVSLAGEVTISQTLVLDEESFAQPRVVAGSKEIELRPYAVACLTLDKEQDAVPTVSSLRGPISSLIFAGVRCRGCYCLHR